MSAKGIKVGYRRVSAVDQKLDRQDLGEVDRVFEEKISGRDRNRPKLEELIRFVREGDQVIVYSIDRLARSLDDLKHLATVADKGILGAITGRAIYEGTLDVAEAQAFCDSLKG